MIHLKLLGFIFWVRHLVWRCCFFGFFPSCTLCWQTSSHELFCPSSASSWAHFWVCFSTSGFCTILLKRLYSLLFKPHHGLHHCCHVLWLSGRKMSWLWRFQLLKVLCFPWKMGMNYLNPWATWDCDGNYMIPAEYFRENDLFPVLRLPTHELMVFIHLSWFWVCFIRIW